MSAQDAARPDDATRFTAAAPPADADATRFRDGPAVDADETRFSAAAPPGTSPTPPVPALPAARDRRLPRRFAGYVLLEETGTLPPLRSNAPFSRKLVRRRQRAGAGQNWHAATPRQRRPAEHYPSASSLRTLTMKSN